jgi:hypothetical protein
MPALGPFEFVILFALVALIIVLLVRRAWRRVP